MKYACCCDKEEEYKDSQKFRDLRKKLSTSNSTEESSTTIPLNCCNRFLTWIDQISYSFEMKSMYEAIRDSPTDALEDSFIQIKRDINRTYPNYTFFKTDSEGYRMLETLLRTY
mmetsp:Transcript_7110/g.6306  ORF Transcript_7110/g.6306 Transcript_7110/m.6306 type:complete len:114 (-) Transcript_7110:785-1126(-)